MIKEITLKWTKLCELEDLDDFLEEERGGVYLWIFMGTPDRIRYIGEAKHFKGRFKRHLTMITHGRYSAVKCRTNEDLRDKYRELSKKSREEAEKKNFCYQPIDAKFKRKRLQKAKFNGEILQKYVDTVEEGIQLNNAEFDRETLRKYVDNVKVNVETFLNCYFLFAEIKWTDVSCKEDVPLREVESIFMHKTRVEYLGGSSKPSWSDCKDERRALWGTVSKYYERNCIYEFTNTLPEDENTRQKIKNILKSIGIKLNDKDNKWTFLRRG